MKLPQRTLRKVARVKAKEMKPIMALVRKRGEVALWEETTTPILR